MFASTRERIQFGPSCGACATVMTTGTCLQSVVVNEGFSLLYPFGSLPLFIPLRYGYGPKCSRTRSIPKIACVPDHLKRKLRILIFRSKCFETQANPKKEKIHSHTAMDQRVPMQTQSLSSPFWECVQMGPFSCERGLSYQILVTEELHQSYSASI